MKSWTVKKRIAGGFATILALVAVLTVTSYVLLRQAKDAAHFLTVDAMPGMEDLARIKAGVCDNQNTMLRDLLARTPEQHKKYRDQIKQAGEQNQKLLDGYEASITTSENREVFGKLKEARSQYRAVRGQLLDLIDAGKTDEAMQLFNLNVDPAAEKYDQLVDQELALNIRNGNRETAQTAATTGHAMSFILVISALVLVFGVLIATVITGGLNKVLRQLALALGDGSAQVSSAASQVSAASQTLAEGASEQASSLEETSSSLEEMASMTKRNAENSQQANDLARQAREAADKGVGDMQDMNTAMAAIKTSSDDIAKIIKTIDEIAFQTNILALNAAVEAARAGEAGMGFAVVADEVRNLAQRSAQAAKETAAKIEGAISKTAQGVNLSQKVTETLNIIVTKARQVDELATEVAGASREQTEGITQINAAVGQMDKVTQSNAASAEESAAAAEELNAQAQLMKQSVSELLELVGGASQTSERVSPVSAARLDESASPHRQNFSRRAVPTRETTAGHNHDMASAKNSIAETDRVDLARQTAGLISWNEEKMTTGVQTIDEQHQELISRINNLHQACQQGTAREELLEQLDFLGKYATTHFAQEEGIMEQHQCPARGRNKAAHVKFLHDYEGLVELVKENGASTKVALELKRMLADWLTSHICQIDTSLRACHPPEPFKASLTKAQARKNEIPMPEPGIKF